MTPNPLLDTLALPRFEDIRPEHIVPALDQAIAEHRAVVARIVETRPTRFAEAWMPLERADTAIAGIWSAVSHLHGVADTPDLRAAYAAGEVLLVENHLRVMQNEALYAVLVALTRTGEFAGLADADRAAVLHRVRDFTLAGVALPSQDRARFAALSVELSQLSTAFGNAVLDATDAWFEHITDEALLAGLADTDKAMFAEAARAKGLLGWVVTLQMPSVSAVLTFAANRDLRERVYAAAGTRASDQGPHAGQFDNSQRIADILVRRHEAARLLGFADPVEWSLATKMAPGAGEVIAFLRDLADRAKPAATAEIAALAGYAAAYLGIADLQPWDIAYVGERMREAQYAIDEQQVRAHFPVERVVAGWQRLLYRLFGIRLTARPDIAVYHPDACYYDVADEQGTVFAGVYVDLHARPGKRGGAWMAQARPRLNDGNVRRVPVAYLVCNFAPKTHDAPSLLSHKEVVTFLHETGHCLHHLFTRVDRPNIAGTNGFEWDAIELPSQLMEDFAWNRATLRDMSGHHETGAPLPDAVFDTLVAARHFLSGMFIVRQVELALFDLFLHLGTLGSDPIEVIAAVRDEVAVVHPPAWHRFPHAFTHIFAGAYASGYYSYLWAEVLAADGFQRFAEAGTIDRVTAEKLRDDILARGASRSAAESFRAFRGRDAQPHAMLARHGLVRL
ncbi:M3 family metallopeptidase [Novosphingobium capsulatum]|uniref:M3 family metallopeptidase n=1 Tax=Novosphingobium capsulatum TaxID=13688 RepID=UPI0007885E9D|nr:M3 family metallopeptidase [Novosphingobium capsulatum]WQD95152.1 M3 family metallopeptidase [Novosphingobium capsulatum]